LEASVAAVLVAAASEVAAPLAKRPRGTLTTHYPGLKSQWESRVSGSPYMYSKDVEPLARLQSAETWVREHKAFHLQREPKPRSSSACVPAPARRAHACLGCRRPVLEWRRGPS
jgi:hypothetical protein